jgi:hypothetical protein
MQQGKWLVPRHASREVFEKDYPKVDFSALEVYCPGCKTIVKLSRKNMAGRVGGWCPKCGRAVAP